MDGAADSWIGSATADISRHGSVDIIVRWVGSRFEQRRCAHDLTGLAVAALRDFNFDPGALQRMIPVGRKPFDSGDFFSYCARHRSAAGAHWPAIQVHSAGAALRNPTAIFCACQAQVLAQDPKQGGRRFDIHIHAAFIYR